ncbi:MAG: restriction endonuclease [Janthinobacterium lividum]
MKAWRAYERFVAQLSTSEYDDTFFTVIPNVRVKGYISGRKRQLDVLIDFRYNADLSRRIIIDAKRRKRPIDIKEVEAFEGLMRDVNAQRGILFCSNGYTKSALKRAQEHIGIRLVTEEEADTISLSDWEVCRSPTCQHGLVLWDAYRAIICNGLISTYGVGKCDECGSFHVWCWDCGERQCLYGEDSWNCECSFLWTWITLKQQETDSSGATNTSMLLLLVQHDTSYDIIDRRPL